MNKINPSYVTYALWLFLKTLVYLKAHIKTFHQKNQQLKVKYKPNKHEASLQCMIKINQSNVTYAMLLLRELLI